MIRNRYHLLIILVVTGLVFFTNLGGPRLWDRDEPRNAGCAAEMLQRGDWVTPVFNDELRTHKPVLLYWLMMSAYAVFGVNEFAARFWSAALGTGTVLLTYFIGQHLFHRRVGLWAAIILASSLMFGVASRAATPDAVLVFFSTAALAAYVGGTFHRSGAAAGPSGVRRNWLPASVLTDSCFPASRPVILGMYTLLAMGVLAKGPVAVILPMAVIGMFMLIQRWPANDPSDAISADDNASRIRRGIGRLWMFVQFFSPRHFLRTLWAMRPLQVLLLLALIALPWYVLVGMRTDGAWLRGFLLEHNLHRAMQPMEGHAGSFLYYPVAALVGFFPWSIFAIPMLVCAGRRVGRDQAGQAGYVFLLCWVGVYIGLFSLAQTKLPSYITPCYPGLALLTAAYVFHWRRQSSRADSRWTYASMGSLVLVGVAILVGIPLAAERYLPGAEWIGWFGMILVAGGVIGTVLISTDRVKMASWTVATTAVAFATVAFGYVSIVVDAHQQADQLLNLIDHHHEAPVVGALGAMEPSWVFYLGQPIHVLHADGKPIQQPFASQGRWAPRATVAVLEFLDQGSNRVVIMTERAFASVREDLPAEVVELGEVRYFLKKERLLAIGHRSTGEVQVARKRTDRSKRR